MSAEVEHGTYAGYQKERKSGVPCRECCDAQALYIRHWRRRTQLVDPLSDLLARRPELRDLAQPGVRVLVGVGENA